NVYDGSTWQSAATAFSGAGPSSWAYSVAIDPLGNATALWAQKIDPTTNPFNPPPDRLLSSRYTASTNSWSTPSVHQDAGAVTGGPKVALDGNGNGIAIWLQAGSLYAKTYTRSTDAWSAPILMDGGSPSMGQLSMSANGNALVTWSGPFGSISAR